MKTLEIGQEVKIQNYGGFDSNRSIIIGTVSEILPNDSVTVDFQSDEGFLIKATVSNDSLLNLH